MWPPGWQLVWRLWWRQWASPLAAILIIGATLAALTGNRGDALMVLTILLATATLSTAQEWRAEAAMQRLRERLALHSRVWRDGALVSVPTETLVPGDVLELRAGELIGADAYLLQAQNLMVVEASLTGESMPTEKWPAPGGVREIWAGTSVRSGTATARITHTGARTRLATLGAAAHRNARPSPFQRNVSEFGGVLMRLLLLVVVLALLGQAVRQQPLLDGLMLAMALAVGLSPELLPVIVTVTLSQGAWRLSRHGVLLRRLDALEDLGSLDVLCTDKTGTLTQGRMQLQGAEDAAGQPSEATLRLACCNAWLESGMTNPLDEALVTEAQRRGWFGPSASPHALPRKLAERPYDFQRRRLTVVVGQDGPSTAGTDAPPDAQGVPAQVITKGAVPEVLSCCTHARGSDGQVLPLDDAGRTTLRQRAELHGDRGLRVLGVATCAMVWTPASSVDAALERAMVFEGLVLFEDPPLRDARRTLEELATRGVRVKMLTGDNRHVAQSVARAVGLPDTPLLTGADLQGMRDEALGHHVLHTSVFAEIDPQHKERIVRALQHRARVVGFLGDGINDAPALSSADVGISVEGAADVARASADLVLTRADLSRVSAAIDEGRRSHANTRAYMAITSSANFGNMLSMAIGGWLLPFAPMTAHQILLNNLLSDLPALTLPQDRAHADTLRHPQHWGAREMRRFMWTFGALSTLFDLATFFLLWTVLRVSPAEFQTAWFITSLLTELAVLLVLRSTEPLWRSRPTATMVGACTLVVLMGVVHVAWPPLAHLLGFEPLPLRVWLTVVAVLLVSAAANEWLKRGRPHLGYPSPHVQRPGRPPLCLPCPGGDAPGGRGPRAGQPRAH